MKGIKRKPAIFLDRDGVITKEKSYVTKLEDLEIFPYAKDCITKIKEAGYYAIVITNQSAIARGILEEQTLLYMNQYLIEQIGIDAIYYCPHYPKGKISKYSITCHCRKPDVGLIEKACKEFSIDLKQSYLVGDRESDILAGQKIGIKTVLVESGYGSSSLQNAIPNMICSNLQNAVSNIICQSM